MDQLIEICALWENHNKQGEPYMAGNVGGFKVLIFPNKFKKENNQPDYRLFITPKKERKPETDPEPESENKQEPGPINEPKQESDDLPF